MRVAIICSNTVSINKNSKRGTEIFDYILINSLVNITDKDMSITAFASGDSSLPVKIESINYGSSISDKITTQKDKHIIFELALLSKAFSMQDSFDLYHINIGDGDVALPFAPFVKKPILITLHYTQDKEYVNKYFHLFKTCGNVFFVSISNTQRTFFPDLNYSATIYHGIEIEQFKFSAGGGEVIMWAGRGAPEKGLEIIFEIVPNLAKKVKVFILRKDEHVDWLNKLISGQEDLISSKKVFLEFDKNREDLIVDYQTSKLFLFPVLWEEPFGLVMIEAMACGTPVIAFAKGAIPEIVQDGKTGFIVNFSDTDIRGNWIIKKTGVEGLLEAVEKIYSMSDREYLKMRNDCRVHVEKYFTAEKMSKNYYNIYKSLI